MSLRRSMLFSLGSWDADALVFIGNHEANTGASMGSVQKTAINNFYKRLKGIGTPHNSNLHAMAVTNGARIYPLCPINDSTANALAYELDMVSNGVNKGVYNNFVSGDFTPQGAIGGTTKFFNSGINATNYSLTNVSYGCYIRSNISSNIQADFGNDGRVSLYSRNVSNLIVTRVNDVTNSATGNSDSRGLFIISKNGTTKYYSKNASKLTLSSVLPVSNANSIYFHGLYASPSTVANPSSRQLAMYIVGLDDLTVNQTQDLYEAVQNYQTEVITGGRQV